MFDLKIINSVLDQLEEERGIPREKVLEAIEAALATAYKKEYGKKGQIVRATFDLSTGSTSFNQVKIVVDETMIKSEEEIAAEEAARLEVAPGEESPVEGAVRRRAPRFDEFEDTEAPTQERKVRFNPEKHIMIEEARKMKKSAAPGEELVFPLQFHEAFGRIAAQTAKQVIIQRIREAEREAIYDEYKGKEGELVSGLIQRVEGRNVFVDIGRAVGVLPMDEQMAHEHNRIGERVKALILFVDVPAFN